MEDALQEKDEKKESFLVISNQERFASTSVFYGIVDALNQLDFRARAYEVHNQLATFSLNFICNEILAHAVSLRNNFDYVLFIGSSFISPWLVKSIQRCGVKVIYVATDDPYGADQSKRIYDMVDIYLSNERAMKKHPDFNKAEYLPTGADHNIYGPLDTPWDKIPQEAKRDIIICGNIYPNRQKILEAIIPFIKEKKYTMGIIGITKLMENKDQSPLKEYILFDKVVDPSIFVKAYGTSKICINIMRDSFYEPNELYTNRRYKIIGESLNPASYEISLSGGTLQLIDNSRSELKDGIALKIGDHCDSFSTPEELCQKIEYYMTHEEERFKIVEQARNYCLKNNTYLSRAQRIVKICRIKAGRHDKLIQDVSKGILGLNGKPIKGE